VASIAAARISGRAVFASLGARIARRSRRTLGCVSVSVNLPDELAARLALEASRRQITPDELAAEVIAERLPARGHRLSFAAVGASTSGRGAADDEEMLAEGFGR
jgi:hypothetical protein